MGSLLIKFKSQQCAGTVLASWLELGVAPGKALQPAAILVQQLPAVIAEGTQCRYCCASDVRVLFSKDNMQPSTLGKPYTWLIHCLVEWHHATKQNDSDRTKSHQSFTVLAEYIERCQRKGVLQGQRCQELLQRRELLSQLINVAREPPTRRKALHKKQMSVTSSWRGSHGLLGEGTRAPFYRETAPPRCRMMVTRAAMVSFAGLRRDAERSRTETCPGAESD